MLMGPYEGIFGIPIEVSIKMSKPRFRFRIKRTFLEYEVFWWLVQYVGKTQKHNSEISS